MAATSQTGEELTNQRSLTSIIIDGTAVVQEMVVYKSQIKTCRDLLDCFVRRIDSKSVGYIDAYVVFDNYSINDSLKDRTRERRTAGKTQDKEYKVDDTTRIKDFKSFLSTKETKANLVLYLAQKAVQLCKVPITTHTEKGVFSSQPNMVNIPSTQEEADTLLFLYAVAVSRQGNTVHIYSCDTDVLVLALRRVPDLKPNSVIIMGTGDRRRQIKLNPIYVALGAERAAALPGFHPLTGSDTTGHIKGKGKSSCFKVFMKADEDVICALAGLGVGVYPSPGVLSGCEKFLCQLFNSGFTSAKALRWHMFKKLKGHQGVEKLLPTQGCIIEHILRAHLQASVWLQDLVARPIILDPVTLGWQQLEDGHYVPVVSIVPAAPEAVVELVKCSCIASKCSGRCSCKAHNLACTELCKCEGAEDTCNNVEISQDPSDDEENEDFENEDLDD